MSRVKIRLLIVFLSIFLIPLSYTTSLAKGYIEASISQNILLFATARLVNAGISVLQTAEGGVGVASVQPGAALDPVDDMVENFSSVLTWAIGALFVQRFALSLAELPMIGGAISAIGLVALAAGFLNLGRISSYMWGLFLSVFFVRVAFVASIYLSFFISNVILEKSIAEASPPLSQFSDKIDQLTGRKKLEIPSSDQLDAMRINISAMGEKIDALERKLQQLEVSLNDLPPGGWFPWSEDESDGQREKLKVEIEGVEEEISSLTESRDVSSENLKCIEAAMGGESCQSIINRVWNAKPSALPDVVAASAGVINSLLLLSAALVLKAILLPILSVSLIFRLLWISTDRGRGLLS